MSQLLQQDSRNYHPVRRPVGQHTTGIPDNPRIYNVVPTQMDLAPAGPMRGSIHTTGTPNFTDATWRSSNPTHTNPESTV